MTQKRYERWNWDLDFGERPLPPDAQLPPAFAIAYYDRLNRLYRVVERVRRLANGDDDDPNAYSVSVYHYFCSDDGRILQKRSIDDDGTVFLIVDIEYDLQKGEAIETAWHPPDGQAARLRRPLSSRQRPADASAAGGACPSALFGARLPV